MIVRNVSEFKKGWMFGDFEPSVLRTKDFELAHHWHPAGFVGDKHLHTRSEEYNYILSGELTANGRVLRDGDMFIYEKDEPCDVTFLKDTHLIVVRVPSAPGDKVSCEEG